MKPAVFLLAISLYAQAPESSAIIRSETRLVLVDTVVTDKKGNYIRDLTQKDFRVFEDNKEQTVTTFSHETGAASEDPDRKRYTLLFFDDTTSSPTLQSVARHAAAGFIEANAGPNKFMAIADLGAGLRVTQNFTQDAERLRQAVAASQVASAGAAVGAALTDYAIRSSLSALQSTIKGLSGLPGRKSVILVAGGYPSTATTQTEIAAIIEACNKANVAVYPVVPTPVVPLGTDASGLADGATATPPARGRRGGPPAQAAVDTSTSGIQQTLYTLANGSGGFVIDTAADLSAGFEKIGKEQQESYILGYTPAKDAAPGACHTLKVKVDRGGEIVRSRSGYCEAKTLDVLSGTPTERDLDARMAANATPTLTGASLSTPFFYTAANTARVDAALEIPAGAIQFVKDKGKFRSALNLVGIAYLPDGTVRARFSDSVKLTFDDKKEVDAFSARPYHYEKQFRLAPGAYTLKLVFSSGANQFGRLDSALSIEPWDPGKFALSALALSRNAQPVKEGITGFDPDLPEDYVPLVAGGAQITPSGSNRFGKSEKCYFYAEVYEPALTQSSAVGAHVEILDAKTGTVKKDLGTVRLRLPPLTGSPAVPMALMLDLSQFEAGEYKLRVTALDAKGNQSARTVDLRLEN